MLCRDCTYEHTTPADREACQAMHGRVMAWPDVRDPVCMCELCGATEALSSLLEHFRLYHAREDPGTGRLVRFVTDSRDVSDYRP